MTLEPRDPRLGHLRRKSTVGEVWSYLRAKRAYWLAPLLLVLLVVSALVILAQSPGGYLLYALF
ncbi:MAG TPA: DUF5989 family protein [Planctomycetota bacterium]|jgi:hypothetical protein|nr:DUF5989 family protein [Planctomycetota bacterium]